MNALVWVSDHVAICEDKRSGVNTRWWCKHTSVSEAHVCVPIDVNRNRDLLRLLMIMQWREETRVRVSDDVEWCEDICVRQKMWNAA